MAHQELAAFAAELSRDEWRLVPSRGEDRRPCGVVVHHVTDWTPRLTERAVARAEGRQLLPLQVDEINAAHAAANPDPDQAETVKLVRSTGTAAAARLLPLADAQLQTGGEGGFTAEQTIERVLIAHVRGHLEELRSALR